MVTIRKVRTHQGFTKLPIKTKADSYTIIPALANNLLNDSKDGLKLFINIL